MAEKKEDKYGWLRAKNGWLVLQIAQRWLATRQELAAGRMLLRYIRRKLRMAGWG
jgi:hypothetical protein